MWSVLTFEGNKLPTCWSNYRIIAMADMMEEVKPVFKRLGLSLRVVNSGVPVVLHPAGYAL